MSEFKLFLFLRSRCDKSAAIAKSRARRYFEQHAKYFASCPAFNRYQTVSDAFSLYRADILLEGLVNKERIEEASELYQVADLSTKQVYEAVHERLPYLTFGANERIYIPFFSPLVNRAYDRRNPALLKPPYSLLKTDFERELIDPFDAYGAGLFDSLYTDLIKVATAPEQNLTAFYSLEMETVFVVDEQGRLEEEIRLFDTREIDRRKDHLFNRLKTLMSFYFSSDRDGFIDSLFNLHFVSEASYQYILRKEARKEEKHARNR